MKPCGEVKIVNKKYLPSKDLWSSGWKVIAWVCDQYLNKTLQQHFCLEFLKINFWNKLQIFYFAAALNKRPWNIPLLFL